MLDFPIIGIGASAGGLEAFHKFFDHMPVDCGMAFVMILHLPADRPSMLPDILSRWTSMQVLQGQDGAKIEPNCVYVPPPHAIVTLNNGCLGIQRPIADQPQSLRPIDAFFDSLASSLQTQAVGIVLSGTGSDGALGLKAIKESGGLTIAQGSNGSAPLYGEMPAGAIATGAVDLVAPIEDIPGHLMRMRGLEKKTADSTEAPKVSTDSLRLQICAILRTQVGHDFSGYRDATFLRRVARRMQVVNTPTLEGYIARLEVDHAEAVLLFRDLLIRVTSFFRDKETFKTLAAQVIPRLFAGKGADAAVRLWVPGCATGEEAYSLAILLREYMSQMNGVPKVQVFATDIDESAIATARQGRYPATLLSGLSPERLERFFKPSQGSFLISKEIRDVCTFSTHNLVRDPPFSRMDLVSCRNLLIYMNPELQSTVIPTFHYSLASGGILLLGGSEGTAKHEDLFQPLEKTARIFLKRDVKSPPLQIGAYQSNLTLQRTALEAIRYPASVRHNSSPPRRVEILAPNSAISEIPPATAVSNLSELELLKQAFVGSQEQLQSLAEQHQTALEELRSANEELHSVNEELQSTNEELETSKEELQSLNEEMHTVNTRLTEKNDELDATNSDLRNLFESTDIATVFLDRHLIIRSFTPAIASIYNLIASDHGRPLSSFVSQLDYTRLPDDVTTVLKTLVPLERRVTRQNRSAHYMMRILPYREPDGAVTGVLVTFIDLTNIVLAETALLEADLRKDVFLATLSHELRNPLAPIR